MPVAPSTLECSRSGRSTRSSLGRLLLKPLDLSCHLPCGPRASLLSPCCFACVPSAHTGPLRLQHSKPYSRPPTAWAGSWLAPPATLHAGPSHRPAPSLAPCSLRQRSHPRLPVGPNSHPGIQTHRASSSKRAVRAPSTKCTGRTTTQTSLYCKYVACRGARWGIHGVLAFASSQSSRTVWLATARDGTALPRGRGLGPLGPLGPRDPWAL